MGISNGCENILRHTEPFDCCAAVNYAGSVFRCSASELHALCVGRCVDCKGDFTFHNKGVRSEADALRAIVGECVLEFESHGAAVAFGWHANLLPLTADIGGTDQGHGAHAEHEYDAAANILSGGGPGNVRQFNLCRREHELGQFQRHVSPRAQVGDKLEAIE